MENRFKFYEKPRVGYGSDKDKTPNSNCEIINIIGEMNYGNRLYYIGRDTIHESFASYENVVFIDPRKETPRTIQDGLKYGDVIVQYVDGDKSIRKCKILGVCDDVVFTSTNNNFSISRGDSNTLSELIKYGWKLESEIQQPEPKTVKMTVAEISKLVGKTVEVVE